LMRADSTRIPDSLAGSITKPMKSSIARSVPKAKKINRSKRIKTREANTNVVKVEKVVLSDSAKHAQLDSLFAIEPDNTHFTHAANQARQVKQNVANANASRESYLKEYRVFEIQWHKILASSLACVAMFLIGAPLGAIIKKGGLGMPFLVSIFFFILYYVLTMQGEKLAKQGSVDVALGVWMPDIVLFIIGFLFLLQARADARLFEADFYHVMVDRVKSWMSRKKAETVVAMK
jgi:lipopolysaccharide export system permease protein